jgi:hypothetical protein
MNLRSSFVMSIALLITAGVAAHADTLNGDNGSWQHWNAATLGTAAGPTYGGPFWNNKSGQGAAANIGWCLVGGGNCSIANPPGALPFFATGNLAAVPTMSFSSDGSAVDVSLAGVFTTQTTPAIGIDYFGYYLLDSSGKVTFPPKQLLSASDALNTAASFSVAPNTKYGFYLENVQGQGTSVETDYWFFMDSTQDTTNRNISLTPFQHVAVFQSGAADYYLGIEDCISSANNSCDQDYNDMIIKVSVASVPEPASAIFGGIGLFSIGLVLGWKLSRRPQN